MTTTPVDIARVQTRHVDAEVLARLRDALVSERSAREALAADYEATATELTGQADVDSILERELADAGAERAHDAIAEVNDALARMAAGTYGMCRSCGTPIPLERLEAIPHARFCVACAPERSSLVR